MFTPHLHGYNLTSADSNKTGNDKLMCKKRKRAVKAIDLRRTRELVQTSETEKERKKERQANKEIKEDKKTVRR